MKNPLTLPGGTTYGTPMAMFTWETVPSPSETTDFLACPQYHAYRWGDERWAARCVGNATRVATLSKAWHAGLAARLRGGDGLPTAQADYRRRLQQMALDGYEWEDAPYPEALLTELCRVTVLEGEALAPPSAVECRLGHAVIDLLNVPEAHIIDHKLLILRDARWIADRLHAFQTRWQFRDYLWRASERFTTPFSLSVHCVVLVEERDKKGKPTGAFLPPTTVLEPVTVTQTQLKRWQDGAERVWQRMTHKMYYFIDEPPERAPTESPFRLAVEVERKTPFQDLTKCANFGYGKPCEFYNACHGAGLNEVEFVRVPRRQQEEKNDES